MIVFSSGDNKMDYVMSQVINAIDTGDLVVVSLDMSVFTIKQENAGVMFVITPGQISAMR